MIVHNKYVSSLEERAAADRVLQNGHVGQGPETEAFERELEERFGRPAAVVSSGTAALYLALRVSGVWDGDAVLIPTYACTSLYHAVRQTGAQVELGDIEPSSFNLDPNFKTRHKHKATIYVHTYGVPGKVPTDGVVISDCSHALGACLDGVQVTQMGDMAVASLGPTKLLATPGAGVVFGSADKIARVKDHRDYDGQPILRERFNLQANDVTAAIGRVRLARLDADLGRRREIASWYGQDSARQVFYRYIINNGWLDTLGHFSASGIQAAVPLTSGELLHRQLGENRMRFPVAEKVAAKAISIPIYPELTDEEVAKVCDALGRMAA